MVKVMWRSVGSGAVAALLVAFAHPAVAEGLRFGHGFEKRATQSGLREELRAEQKEQRRDDWREHQTDRLDEGRRTGRLDARYDSEPTPAVRRLSAEERRQLRRDLQGAARDLYSR